MNKKAYSKPAVTNHDAITFETGLSSCVCVIEIPGPFGSPIKVCVKSDDTWDPIP